SGLGKVLLSALPEQSREFYLRQPRAAITPTTITDADALRAELERIVARGYAIDDEESNLGVVCIAAPIRDGGGRITAAVSISGPRAEFDADGNMDRLTGLVRSAASDISARLGWTGDGS
ncbi:MAG: IclR family transcriptional regulator, partial [Chloroflexia bacterium]|nr:IclR family transcriptional regulator [Chloroflexia bacterium]